MWDGLRLLQEHKHSQTSLYAYEDEGYEPLARVDGIGPLQKIRYYHNDLNGLEGGLNLYQYAPNPIGWADPWGWAYAGVDFTGGSDLFPTTGSQRNIVTIKMQGRRTRDFTQAFKEAGIPKSAATGYTWHHVDDFNSKTGATTMQLVKTSAHEATFPHGGSVAQFEKHFKVNYDKGEAVLAASKKGWLANKIPKNKLKPGRCS